MLNEHKLNLIGLLVSIIQLLVIHNAQATEQASEMRIHIQNLINQVQDDATNASAHLEELKEAFDIANQNNWKKERMQLATALGNYYIFSELNITRADSIVMSVYDLLADIKNLEVTGPYYTIYMEVFAYSKDKHNTLSVIENEILPYFETHNDSLNQNHAYALLKAAETCTSLGKMAESSSYFAEAELRFELQKDSLFLMWTKNGLAKLYSDNGLYEEAKKERQFIINQAPRLGYAHVACLAYIGACVDGFSENGPEENLENIRQAMKLEIDDNIDIKPVTDILRLSFSTMAYVNANIKDTADYYHSRLIALNNTFDNNPFVKKYYNMALASHAILHNQLKDARVYVSNMANTATSRLEEAYTTAKIEQRAGNYKLANEYLSKYIRLKRQQGEEISQRRFAFVQSQNEVEKKDRMISDQQQALSLLKAKNKLKNQWILFGGTGLIGLMMVVFLIRKIQFARKKNKLQEQFAQDLLIQIETERKRIANELHDEVGQKLVLIKRYAENSGNIAAVSTSKQSLINLRKVIKGLHPVELQEFGFTHAINGLIREIDEISDMLFMVEIDEVDDKLNEAQQFQLYRIIQEMLSNIIKHAQAKAVEIILEIKNSTLSLSLSDNGVGINNHQNMEMRSSLGLKSIYERTKILGASLTLHSEDQKGTQWNLNLPLH